MADKDTGGSLALRRPLFTAAAVASVYAVELVGPADGARIPALAVPLSLLVSSVSGLGTDVQVNVSTSANFSALVYDNTFTDRPNGQFTFTLSAGLTEGTVYYWRARAAETGTTSWAAWTPARTFSPRLDAGKGFGYSDQNVGVFLVPSSAAFRYSDQNIGVFLVPSSVAFRYSDENIGVFLVSSRAGFGQVYAGDVSTNPPDPRVWFLLPASGRSGDGIRIFCFGVGDLQGTYSGSVELDYGGTVGWVAVPVISWQTFPPGPAAYAAARKLDPANGYIDMQHSVVEIVIPDGAAPPGYPVRIRTVTP